MTIGTTAGGRRLRKHAREVALMSTLVAIVLYVVVVAVADLVVLRHVQGNIDARLSSRLSELAAEIAPGGTISAAAESRLQARSAGAPGGSDVDDAPIFSWWVPTNSGHPLPLENDAPPLGTVDLASTGAVSATIAGRSVRTESLAIGGGHLVAATSAAQYRDIRSVLLLVQLLLLPIVAGMFFVVASIIGRRAATPIELARKEQLDFTADASHELRTPLSVIEAEVSLALSSPRPPEEYRAALERVAGESDRLQSIVDDLLWLARFDALPAPPGHDLVDLGTVASACAARFVPVAQLRKIELEVCVDVDVDLLVRAPAEWLDRLVSVLVDNACRYCNEGGRITVVAGRVSERPSLSVTDSGAGIDPAQREALVRRFHRSSAIAGGAGLGLAIADAIVGSTAGRWELDDTGTGKSCFTVSWPRSSL